MRKMRTVFILAAAFLLIIARAAAQEWTEAPGQEHEATPQENRIIKWCSLDGSRVRYASANIELKGYRPCGRLQTATTCDAGGKRLIGSYTEAPKGYLDCGKGPRIIIERHDGPAVPAPPDAGSPDPLSEKEKRALRYQIDKLAKDQAANDPLTHYQPAFQALLDALLGIGAQPHKHMPANNDMLKQLMKQLPPAEADMLRKMMLPPKSRKF